MIPPAVSKAASAVLKAASPVDSHLRRRSSRLQELHSAAFWRNYQATHYWDGSMDLTAGKALAERLYGQYVPAGRDFLTQMKSWDFYVSI